MDYQQTLEKAVLEHAATVRRNPQHTYDKPTKIPGFPDTLVWQTARHLSEKGYISTSSVAEDGTVIVAELKAEGSARLEELKSQAEQEEAQRQQEYAAAVAANKKKKSWWQVWK